MTRFGTSRCAVVLAASLALASAVRAAGPDAGFVSGGRALVGEDAGLDREEAPLDAEQATRIFTEANALYADGDYDGSVARYERVLSGGIENADVRYNLANAYYKTGMVGRAVLNYERALRLDSAHEDARANLEFLTDILADRQTSVGGPVSDLLEHAYARATPTRLAVLASLFYFILVGALVAGILRGAVTGWTARLAVVMGIHLVVAGGLLALRLYQERSIREAVVLAPEVGVSSMSEPHQQRY